MYSTDSDLLSVLPGASGYISSTLTATTEFARHRSFANAEIENQIKGRTVVPASTGNALVASGLAEIEAYYTAYRLLRQNFSSKDMDGSREFINSYKKDGDALLKDMYFPACADTPTKLQSFTGNGGIAVTCYDQFTYTADWVVKCTSASGPQFEIWNNQRGTMGYYDLSDDTSFPDTDHQEGSSGKSLFKEIRIVITGGSTGYALGDTFAFRTYGRMRLNQQRGFSSIEIRRV